MDVCNTCAGDHGKPEEGVSVLHPQTGATGTRCYARTELGFSGKEAIALYSQRPPEDPFPQFSTLFLVSRKTYQIK